MTPRLIITIYRLSAKNATVQNPLDQVILVRLSESGYFLKSNVIEETLPLSTVPGKPTVLELMKYSVRRANGDSCASKF